MALDKSIANGREHRSNRGHINWIPCMKKDAAVTGVFLKFERTNSKWI